MKDIVPIPTPSEGNPLYPLPPDYVDGTREYQRSARVNACRQNLLPRTGTPLDALRITESLRFFDEYYLRPDEEDDFDSYFYDMDPAPNPPFHYHLYTAMGLYRLNAIVAPRGAAKSTMKSKEMTKHVVTVPKRTIVYSTSTQSNAMRAATRIRDAIYNNRRIFDDFALEDEFDGAIQPSRGSLSTGTELFYLNNRAWINSISAQGRQRGLRPWRYVLDDPEYDADGSTDVSMLRENLEWFIFRVVMPMLLRPGGVGCDWIGTYVSKRHLLWAATKTVMKDGRKVAEDSRFDMWNRIIVPMIYEDDEGKEQSCWPQMWPLNEEQKEELKLPKDAMTVVDIKKTLGESVFKAEMMGLPGEGDGIGFGEPDPDKHGYWFTGADDALEMNPIDSNAKIEWWRDGERESMDMETFFRNTTRLVAMDTAYGNGESSDWKVATLMALVRATNELFVLDMFHTKEREQVLVARAHKMAVAWRASMHPEYVARQGKGFETNCLQYCRGEMVAHPRQFVPTVSPLKVGNTPKPTKIEGLTYRFDHGLIKLPFELKKREPWSYLFHQIMEFNPAARDGGLTNDDHLDTVSMGNMIVRAMRGEIRRPEEVGTPRDITEMLLTGRRTWEDIDLAPHVFNHLDVNTINQLMEDPEHGNDRNRRDQTVV